MSEETTSDWIEWSGGECPVDRHQKVKVQLRCDDDLASAERASADLGTGYRWTHNGSLGDIIAYRVVSP